MASSDDNILSENLRGTLDHAAALVAQSAGSEAPHLVDRLMVATRARFNESLARALRLRNASALCFSLPNELWVKIWSVMDTRHRLNVSHVCHGWRALAVSTPSLWASISVTCRIRAVPHTFFCSSCMDSNAIEKYITTIDLCDYLLQRTADSPLSVRVSADAVSYYPKYAEDVCELLRIHGHRIVRLEVLCPIAAFINELLDLLLPLPSLHDLIIGNAGIVLSHAEPAFEERFELPSLQTLEISFGFRWDPNTAQLHLPSLNRLTLSISDPEELRAALRSCPALRDVRLLPPFGSIPRRWKAMLVAHFKRISSVIIEAVDVAEEVGISEIFEHTLSTSVSLLYLRPSPTVAAFHVLRSLRGPVRLSCGSAVDQQKEMAFSDASRTISFTWPDDPPAHLHWSSISRASFSQYQTDTRAWPGVLWNLPCAESVDELTLHLDSAEEFNRVVQYQGSDQSAAAFHGLSVLRLYGDGKTIRLDTACVVALVNKYLGEPPAGFGAHTCASQR